MGALLDMIHFLFGRINWISVIALKIRNQCNNILKYRLCIESNPFKNGEYFVLNALKDQIGVFADVGANFGEYSGQLMKSAEIRQAYIFEPSKKCFVELRKRFSDNSFVQIYNFALSDTIGTGQFHFDNEVGETSSLVGPGKNSYSVKVDTLDNVLKDINLDLLKIDTEGYDLHVLKGAERLLSEGKIKFIQFEYGSFWRYAGSTLYSSIKYLNGLGYQVFRIDKNGLYEHDYEKFGEYFSYSNFFSCQQKNIEYVKHFLHREKKF